MMLRTCFGCIHHGNPCVERDALKASLRGLGVTSIKWKCRARKSQFEIGDPVWVDTVESYQSQGEYDERYRADFPGHVVRVMGGKALVYIRPGAPSDSGDYSFEAAGSGFCKIPFIRMRKRGGAREDVCRDCNLPSSFGHAEGYICARLPAASQSSQSSLEASGE